MPSEIIRRQDYGAVRNVPESLVHIPLGAQEDLGLGLEAEFP